MLNSIISESSILVQIALHFSNSFSSSILKGINLLILSSTLNILSYSLILGIIETNGLKSFFRYPIKY